MIEIRVLEDSSGTPVGLRARGHSGSAPAGRDLVCAAVTTVFEMLTEGTRNLPPGALDAERRPEETRWFLRVSPDRLEPGQRRTTRHLFDAARRVLENVAENHPDFCSISTGPPDTG